MVRIYDDKTTKLLNLVGVGLDLDGIASVYFKARNMNVLELRFHYTLSIGPSNVKIYLPYTPLSAFIIVKLIKELLHLLRYDPLSYMNDDLYNKYVKICIDKSMQLNNAIVIK